MTRASPSAQPRGRRLASLRLARPLPYARLGDDAFEHVERAGERLGRLGDRLRVLRRDRLAGAIDDAARLLHRVLTEVAAGDGLLDAREQRLDLLDQLLRR